MNISVVIPTLNEENLLPDLLADLRIQTFDNFEVIVSDAGSQDKTIQIAQDAGASVVKGGLPAVARNSGASIAKSNFIFFLDADVRIPSNFIEKAYNEIEENFIDIATCKFLPLSEEVIDKLLHNFVNSALRVYQFIDPHAPGFCILVSKRLFNRINGFDETLKLAEDHDFVKRASAFRPLQILDSTYVEVSTRRLDKEGRFRLVNKYILVELYRLFNGEIKEDVIKYEFASFGQSQKSPQIHSKLQDAKKMTQRLNRLINLMGMQQSDGDISTNEFKENLEKIKAQLEKMKKNLKSIFRVGK